MADGGKEERLKRAREELAALREKKRVLDETRHRTARQVAAGRRAEGGE